MFLLTLTILIVGCSVEQMSALTYTPTTALSFGHDTHSYIMLKLNMEPVKEAISVCSWVNKKTSAGTYDVWLSYNAPGKMDEILIAGKISTWAYMLLNNLENTQDVPSNEWHHVCITWSFESKKIILYFDGKAIKQENSGDRKLAMDGTMAIGQYHAHADMRAEFHDDYAFGGELLKMNIYKRQLTAGEVEKMYSSGKCSEYEDTLVADVFLGWKTILHATERHGTITDVLMECPGDYRILHYFADFYNKLLNSELLEKMKERFEEVGKFFRLRKDEPLLEHLEKQHQIPE